MTTLTLTLSANGQITLPKAIRKKMGLKPGDKIDYNLTKDNKLELSRLGTLQEFLADFQASLTPEQKAAIKRNAGKTTEQLLEEAWQSDANKKSRIESYEF